mmetsp:Transcript_2515/g.3503  ORF Transcript_2515/g.3503 Transcript_2515/m.3503 type:complete len:402 (-) Transcript_2515:126-1331(-)
MGDMGVADDNKLGNYIELNVGGTVFFCSKSLLTYYCSYFSSKFSDDWTTAYNHTNERGNKQIFIDHNPEPFRILLNFMRENCIECREICSIPVLLQAEFFGVDDLLNAVKFRSYINKHPEFRGSPHDVIHAFNSRYGGIKDAISKGILPSYLVKRERRKEYALLGKSSGRFLVQGPKRLFDDGPFDDLSAESGLVPISPLFLDCLNWLGMNGFVTLDIPECVVQEGIRRIFFSRFLAYSSKIPEHELWNSFIIDNNRNADEHNKKPISKQYALLTVCSRSIVPDFGGVGMLREVAKIEADLGLKSEIEFRGQRIHTNISKVSGLNEATTVSCMNWLQTNGYTRREPELEEFYKTSQSISSQKTISIFSRMYDESFSLELKRKKIAHNISFFVETSSVELSR